MTGIAVCVLFAVYVTIFASFIKSVRKIDARKPMPKVEPSLAWELHMSEMKDIRERIENLETEHT